MQLRFLRNKFATLSHYMRSAHKPKKKTPPNELKAAVIREHGTIAAYIRSSGRSAGTVYSALKNRRSGPVARAIREEVMK